MKISEKDIFLEFVGKFCKLRFKTGFLIDGTVISVSDIGIIFETEQKTAFIAFSEISSLTPRGD